MISTPPVANCSEISSISGCVKSSIISRILQTPTLRPTLLTSVCVSEKLPSEHILFTQTGQLGLGILRQSSSLVHGL